MRNYYRLSSLVSLRLPPFWSIVTSSGSLIFHIRAHTVYSIDDLVTSVLSKKFTLLQWNPVTTTTKTTTLLLIIIIMVYLTHPRGGFPVKIYYLQLKINNNALSSVESRLLGDIVVKGVGAVILLFHLEYKKSVICHNLS